MARNPFEEEKIIEVYRARDPLQAHLFVAELENDGIQSQILGENLGGALGEIPLGWSTAPRIFVRESDALQARELLLSYEQRVVTESSSKEQEEEYEDEELDPVQTPEETEC